jgi:hypothetical protein
MLTNMCVGRTLQQQQQQQRRATFQWATTAVLCTVYGILVIFKFNFGRRKYEISSADENKRTIDKNKNGKLYFFSPIILPVARPCSTAAARG